LNPALQTSTDGYYRLSSPEMDSQQGPFSNAIKLPNLKQGVKNLVEIWTSSELLTYNDSTGTVAHDEGVVRARFPIKVYGKLAAFFDSPGWWFPVTLLLPLVVWSAFLVGRFTQPSKASSQEAEPARPKKKGSSARKR